MSERLQEYADSRGQPLRVDRRAAVLRGVKILGLESRNGRSYAPAALVAARGLYEGAKVHVNHPRGGPLEPRDYQDRIGVIRQVAVRAGEGLFADLHYNPAHALAAQLAWDAEHAPENVGFSHHVEAQVAVRDGRTLVERIDRVLSVDLVADPATTRGLFEAAESSGASQAQEARVAVPAAQAAPPPWAACSLDALRAARPDLIEQLSAESQAEAARLRAELDAHRRDHARQARERLAAALLAEHGLPDWEAREPAARDVIPEEFRAAIREAADDRAVRALVEQHARLVQACRALPGGGPGRGGRPVAREQHRAEALLLECRDAASFVAAIT